MGVKEVIFGTKNPNQWIKVSFLAIKKRLIITNIDCKLKEIGKEKKEKSIKNILK
jgi:hypothetical protein